MCADFTTDINTRRNCWEAPPCKDVLCYFKCPQFNVITPDSEALHYISITAFGTDGLLVDSWSLYKKGKFVRSWWSNNRGAVCLSDQYDYPCWPNITNAGMAVSRVRLYMSLEIERQNVPDLDTDWGYILYDILHDCKSPDQCKTLLCPNGTCWSPNPLLTMKMVDQDLMESHGLVDTVYSIEVEVINILRDIKQVLFEWTPGYDPGGLSVAHVYGTLDNLCMTDCSCFLGHLSSTAFEQMAKHRNHLMYCIQYQGHITSLC